MRYLKVSSSILLPFLMVLVGITLFFGFHLYRYVNFATLKAHRDVLLLWAHRNYGVTVIAYVILYVLAMLIAMPVAGFLAVLGGFLFGIWPGLFYSVSSATLGATLFFLLARGMFGDGLKQLSNQRLKSFMPGFQKNAFKYIISLRLMPIVPFWLINMAAAVSQVELSVFVSATFIGVIPACGIYVTLGQHLN